MRSEHHVASNRLRELLKVQVSFYKADIDDDAILDSVAAHEVQAVVRPRHTNIIMLMMQYHPCLLSSVQ